MEMNKVAPTLVADEVLDESLVRDRETEGRQYQERRAWQAEARRDHEHLEDRYLQMGDPAEPSVVVNAVDLNLRIADASVMPVITRATPTPP
ncbi:hypothetical protein HK405_000897, partial [Cladochytrium tenue]